jgi:Mg2+ and Co2+ transporter CorA
VSEAFRARANEGAAAGGEDRPRMHVVLFDAQARTRSVELDEVAGLALQDHQLLWIDLTAPDEETLSRVWEQCGLPEAARHFHGEGTTPLLCSESGHFWLRVVAACDHASHPVAGALLTLVAGDNRIVSLHDVPIGFIDTLRERGNDASPIGALGAESFVAALLDWQLSTYFEAVSDYEKAIERLENDILVGNGRPTLAELRRLRSWASRLRRMLAPHRSVFGALSRPDFRPSESRAAERHFVAIDTRFERAMDMVENARDLVLGSFELFSSQTALQTNESMKVLTFVTVITGGLATLVGALGMNFDASFFGTQDLGFWIAIAGLGLVTAAALLLGRRRRWF